MLTSPTVSVATRTPSMKTIVSNTIANRRFVPGPAKMTLTASTSSRASTRPADPVAQLVQPALRAPPRSGRQLDVLEARLERVQLGPRLELAAAELALHALDRPRQLRASRRAGPKCTSRSDGAGRCMPGIFT